MKNYIIPKLLVDELKKIYQLVPSDLKNNDFNRGFKLGQLDVLNKIETMYNKQEKEVVDAKYTKNR